MTHFRMPSLGKFGLLTIASGLTLWGSLTIAPQKANAAETIVMRYGPIQRSLPIKDLRQLSDTGKPTRKLRRYLKLAKQEPEALRSRLNNPIRMSVVTLDSRLNSVPGNLLLDEAGRYIHPPGQRGSRQAIRSALVLSAADDDQITLLESLENYPTPVVEVDVEKSVALYRRIDGVLNGGGGQPGISPIVDFLNRRIRSLLK